MTISMQFPEPGERFKKPSKEEIAHIRVYLCRALNITLEPQCFADAQDLSAIEMFLADIARENISSILDVAMALDDLIFCYHPYFSNRHPVMHENDVSMLGALCGSEEVARIALMHCGMFPRPNLAAGAGAVFWSTVPRNVTSFRAHHVSFDRMAFNGEKFRRLGENE